MMTRMNDLFDKYDIVADMVTVFGADKVLEAMAHYFSDTEIDELHSFICDEFNKNLMG
jgi:hypothetical protein